MQARMNNIVSIVPDAMKAMHALAASAERGGVAPRTNLLVMLRASQINGCSFCVDMHSRELKKAVEADERIFTMLAWRIRFLSETNVETRSFHSIRGDGTCMYKRITLGVRHAFRLIARRTRPR